LLPWLGLAIGVIMALAGVQQYGPGTLEPGEVARVNGTSIAHNEWQRAIDAANSGRRTPLDTAAEHRILETLINEELLLQMALNLGLAHGIPEVRGKLVQAAMDALAGDMTDTPSAADLQQFVSDNPGLFSRPERRRTQVRRYRSPEAANRDQDGTVMDIPAEALNLRQLQRWVGHSVATAAFAIDTAPSLSAPIAVGKAWYRVQVLETVAAYQPNISEIPAESLLRAWQREQRELNLAQALQELRRGADITTDIAQTP